MVKLLISLLLAYFAFRFVRSLMKQDSLPGSSSDDPKLKGSDGGTDSGRGVVDMCPDCGEILRSGHRCRTAT